MAAYEVLIERKLTAFAVVTVSADTASAAAHAAMALVTGRTPPDPEELGWEEIDANYAVFEVHTVQPSDVVTDKRP